MPEGRTPILTRLSGMHAVCLRSLAVLLLSLVFAAGAQAQSLTINRYVDAFGTEVDPGDSYNSVLNWTNNGFTNISGVSIRIVLDSIPDNEMAVGDTSATMDYNIGGSNQVIEVVYGLNPTNTATSLDQTFTLTNSFTTPGVTNEWSLTVFNDLGAAAPAVFEYWRLIVTGDAVTNGTIEAGAGGIISGSDGYTVDAVISAGSGTGSNAVTAFVTSGQSLNFNGGLSGTGELAKTGAGTLSLAGNSSGFSGSVNLTAGTANITTTTALGTGTLFQTNGSSTAIFSAGGNYTNNMTLANVSFTNGGNTLSGTITNSGSGTFLTAASTTNTISGVMTGSGGLTKDGDGVLLIAGSTNNTYTGATVVSDGSLVLSNSSGNAIHSSSSITVTNGATLVLGASNQIGDGVSLILGGGTLLVGALNVTEDLGTLTLTANSTIDFGNFGASGLRQLTFDNSAGVTWASNAVLTITNWQGVALTSSDFTEIFFGDGGLTTAQQGQIFFANQNITGGTLLGTGELVPVPEPPVYAAALAILAAVGWRERRRLTAFLRRH